LKFPYQTKIVVVALIAAAALVFLLAVRDLLTPMIWAMIVAYVFNPLVTTFCKRTKLHRFWGVALLYAVVAALIVSAFLFLVPHVQRELEQLERDFPQLVGSLFSYLIGRDTLQILGFQITSEAVVRSVDEALQTVGTFITSHALPVFFGALRYVAKILLFLFATFYFLLDADRMGALAKKLLPLPIKGELVQLAADVDDVLGRWVRGQLLLVVIMSSATAVALTLLQVRYAIVLAILTGILELFPIVGPIVAGAIASIVALFQPNPFGWSNLTYVVTIALLYFVLRHAEDYFVIPNVIGRVVELHPLGIIFAVFAGGQIAGMLGMFIAAPTFAVLRIVLVYLYGKLVDLPAEPEALDVKMPARGLAVEAELVDEPNGASAPGRP